MVAWHLHLTVWLQLQPDWAPMQYNSALCLFVAGSGFVAAALGQTRLVLLSGVFVAVVGLLSGLESVLGIDLGIDQLLFTHDIVVNTSSPGRMGPNTAMCFGLLGSAIFMMGFRLRQGESSSVAIMLASLAVGMALVVLAGYLTGPEQAYGWDQYTSMALHTAVGILVLGVGISAFQWPYGSTRNVDVNRLVGVLVSVTTLGVLLIVLLAAAIGLIPTYEQLRSSVSERAAQSLNGEAIKIQQMLASSGYVSVSTNVGTPGAQDERTAPSARNDLGKIMHYVDAWRGPGKAYLGVLKAQGALVVVSGGQGVWRFMPAPALVGQAVTQAIASARVGKYGMVTSQQGERRIAFFSPIMGTPWVLVSAVSADELYAQANNKLLLIIMIVMLVALSGAFGIVRLLHPLTSGILVHSNELEHRISQATSELQANVAELKDRNMQLQEFSYVVSHDLQAPLRGIDGFARLLERKHGPVMNKEAKEYLAFIRQGAEQMSGFIQGFLQLSRLGSQSQPMNTVDVNGTIEKIREQLRYALEAGGAKMHNQGLPQVLGDAGQVQQLFQNLIDNAIKFRAPERPLEITIQAHAVAQRWQFSVCDNGLGVDPAQAKLIFKLFQRASDTDDVAGTGIGLALCAKIVRRHGGGIEVQPTPGGGATFVFDLAGV